MSRIDEKMDEPDDGKELEEKHFIDVENSIEKEFTRDNDSVNPSNSDSLAENVNSPISVKVLDDEEVALFETVTLKIVGTQNAGDALLVSDEGTWSIEDNQIVFTPLADFEGTPKAIFYTIENNEGIESNPIQVTINSKIIDSTELNETNSTTSVTINILEKKDKGLDVRSIEIVLPKGFVDKHPESVLSDDRKILTVPGEGIWEVKEGAMVSFTAEEGFVAKPTNISYLVLVNSQEKSVVGTIDVINKVEVDSIEEERDNVSTLSNFTLLFMVFFSGVLGMFFLRKTDNEEKR